MTIAIEKNSNGQKLIFGNNMLGILHEVDCLDCGIIYSQKTLYGWASFQYGYVIISSNSTDRIGFDLDSNFVKGYAVISPFCAWRVISKETLEYILAAVQFGEKAAKELNP